MLSTVKILPQPLHHDDICGANLDRYAVSFNHFNATKISLSAAYRQLIGQAISTNSELVALDIPTFNLRQHIRGWSQSWIFTRPWKVNPCTQAKVNAKVIRSFAIASCDVISNSTASSPLSLNFEWSTAVTVYHPPLNRLPRFPSI